jgi:hypothetical protein
MKIQVEVFQGVMSCSVAVDNTTHSIATQKTSTCITICFSFKEKRKDILPCHLISQYSDAIKPINLNVLYTMCFSSLSAGGNI